MRIKNKKAMEGGTWWIIIGAIVAIMIAAIILFIVKGGLYSGQDSVNFLQSCNGQGGVCLQKGQCADGREFYKLGGCPDQKKTPPDPDGSDYCCIPKT